MIEKTLVRFDKHWSYRGLTVLRLENRYVRVDVIPEVGARIWHFVYKMADHDLLWHNPRIPLAPVPFGASYDDYFMGGWDELFPNDAPAEMNGERYPDHGEVWSAMWEWSVDDDAGSPSIVLRRATPIATAILEKRLRLVPDAPILRCFHSIKNVGPTPIHFLWKLHIALAMSSGSRFALPGGRILPERDIAARIIGPFEWPVGVTADGGCVDMRLLPEPDTGVLDFFYATELPAGWCAMTDGSSGVGLGISFDHRVFRSVWWFASYDGWRGHRVFIMEPCTGYPYRLEEAVRSGNCTTILPGGALVTEVLAVAYQGGRSVTYIGPDGNVDGEGTVS